MHIFLMIVLYIFTPFATFADPEPWQMGFQEPITEKMEQMIAFHDLILWILGIIVLFVVLLLAYVLFKFNKRTNPEPSKTTHNNFLEIVWTIIPLIIVISLIFPSVDLIRLQETIPEPELTLKVTGYQWYWGYEYPDHGGIQFDSNMKQDKDLKEGELRLLEVDNRVVVPVNTNVRVLVTSADVVHSWTVPSFGIKKDAIPGRLSETWFNAKKTGIYRGQCSELCGMSHGFMPIVVEVVTKKEFDEWIKTNLHKHSQS